MIDKNTRLLSFCPTRSRPDKLKALLESFDRCKSPGTEIFIYVANDSKHIPTYEHILEGRDYVIGDRPSCLVEIVNKITREMFPNIPYYQCLNDDHYIVTEHFDNRLIDVIEKQGKGWGIAFGRYLVNEDTWAEHRHPSAEITSGNIPRTLGYYCTPMLKHHLADTFARDINEGIGRFFRVMDVIIEHRHFVNGMAAMDENYQEQYSGPVMEEAWKNYIGYQKTYMGRDIDKLKEAMAQ